MARSTGAALAELWARYVGPISADEAAELWRQDPDGVLAMLSPHLIADAQREVRIRAGRRPWTR